MIKKIFPATFFAIMLFSACSKKMMPVDSSNGTGIQAWNTTGDEAKLLEKQPALIPFTANTSSGNVIEVNESEKFQSIDGFGYSLTGGSAQVINRLPHNVRSSLLKELFGNGDGDIHVSYLRVSIGASDLDSAVFSYDDLPAGETDPELMKFSIDPDRQNLIPVLKEILSISPQIKILGSPWSPPVWMKDNKNSKGGSLLPEYHNAYARYFIKYINAMKDEGITIDAITIQNEPLHPGNNPSLLMPAEQQRDFIKNSLGPAFDSAGIKTKIILYDHNCDRPDYPMTVLADAEAAKYVDGSAFHLYNGDISALSQVYNAYPDKALYFTEQWTGAKGTFKGDLQWHVKNVIIGSMRNWSRVALEWNLASDENYEPHTPGGCTECKGALTIDSSDIKRNVGYHIIAHASKFVPPGSVRIASNIAGNLYNAAFLTPDGRKVLIVINDSDRVASFAIKAGVKFAQAALAGGGVGTYVW
jgi:glucosylceramidase